MKIGIFDSGLGGLIMARAIQKMLPAYDYVYLGDTKRVPYGNRSQKMILDFTLEAVDFLLNKKNCEIIIIACNTASAKALKEIKKSLPNKKIFGVIVPATEACNGFHRIGILGTKATISSNAFLDEILKINKNIKVFQNSAPMLVPLAEEGEHALAVPFIKKYLAPLLKKNIDALVLGCTHYPIFKKEIKKVVGKNIKIISQDEIIPKKLKDYLVNHPEIDKKLSKNNRAQGGQGKVEILVTDLTQNIEKLSKQWFGKNIKPKLVKI